MARGRLLSGALMAGALAVVTACGGGGPNAVNGPKVTLTGCLQPGTEPNTYRLATTGAPNGAVGTTGEDNQTSLKDNPTGTPSKSNSSDVGMPTTRMYTLLPGREVDLSPHQGTVVEVTGRLEQEGTLGTSNDQARTGTAGTTGVESGGRNTRNPATGTGSDASTRGATADRGAARVYVEAVKRMSGTCGDTK